MKGRAKGVYNSSGRAKRAELLREVDAVCTTYREPALVEEFSFGTGNSPWRLLGKWESTCGVLPIVEIRFDALPPGAAPIYSTKQSGFWDTVEKPLEIYGCPAELDGVLLRQIEDLARKTVPGSPVPRLVQDRHTALMLRENRISLRSIRSPGSSPAPRITPASRKPPARGREWTYKPTDQRGSRHRHAAVRLRNRCPVFHGFPHRACQRKCADCPWHAGNESPSFIMNPPSGPLRGRNSLRRMKRMTRPPPECSASARATARPSRPRPSSISLKSVVVEEMEDIKGCADVPGIYDKDFLNVDSKFHRLVNYLQRRNPDLVFNLVESVENESAQEMNVAGVYELMKIPFTGAGPLGLGIALKKARVKEILTYHGIPTPAVSGVCPGRKGGTGEGNEISPHRQTIAGGCKRRHRRTCRWSTP